MDALDVIETFADGELIDPSALKAALGRAEARDHLVDILVLRGLVAEQPGRRGVVRSRPRPSPARWGPAAAVIALVGAITGYVAGIRSTAPPSSTPVSVSSAAPAPTQVIQLHNGVDWTERSGGR